MKILAIAGCAALLTSCSPRAHAPTQATGLRTPVMPAPSPTQAIETRAVTLRLQTLKGENVTTVIHLPPNLPVGPQGMVLQPKTLWRVPAAPSPAPPEYVQPQLTAAGDSIFVSTGTDVERIGTRGHVLWRSHKAAAPFAVGSNIVAAAHMNAVTALNERDGALRWRRAVCPASVRVAALAMDGRTIFALCAGEPKLVALRFEDGRVLYKRVLAQSGRGTSLKILGSGALLADVFFQGAWMGDNFFVVREHTGDVVLKRTNIELFRVRDSIADFVDRSGFGRSDTYEPANILSVNLLTGETGKESELAPERQRFQEDGGGGSYGPDGTVFTGERYLYLFYGDTLFRYSELNAAPVELLRGIERLIYAHDDGLVAVLEGDPDPVLFRIDWTAKRPVLHPVAAIESAWPNQTVISPAPIATDILDDIRLIVSAHGTIERLPGNCPALGAAPATTAQMIATICRSGSRVEYVEAFSVGP